MLKLSNVKDGTRLLLAGLIGIWFAAASSAMAAGGGAEIKRQHWTFAGVFGHYDQAQLQRGFQVYKEVCAACHSMKLLSYRNLGQSGGPAFPVEQVKALAADAQIVDGPNDDGEMFERKGKPADRIASPYKNDKEAAAANGGALPPDLSVIAKARGAHKDLPWYLAPFQWLKDIALGYEEGGADYLYALMTSYKNPPSGFELIDGLHYNAAFPGHQIAMPAPLSDDAVDYSDGSPQTVAQYSRDLSAFLMWAADPTLEERKKLGFRVLIYLIILTLLLYLAKRKIWSRVEH